MTGYFHAFPPPHQHSLAILPFYDLRCSVLKPYTNRTLAVDTVNGYRLHNRYIVLRIPSEAKGLSTDRLWDPPSSYFMSIGDVKKKKKNTVGRKI
jgi:hypothetical protein